MLFSRPVTQILRSPLQMQTYQNLLYLLLMFPLGILYFNVLTIGFLTGIPLMIIGIGIPIVLVLFVITIKLASFERWLVCALLDVDIPTSDPDTDGTIVERVRRLVAARQTWKSIAYLFSEFVYGSLVFGILASGFATSLNFLFAPTYYTEAPVRAYEPIPTSPITLDLLFGWDALLVGLTTTFQLGSWRIESLIGALLVSALGAILFWMILLFSNAATQLWATYARRMLTTSRYWTTPER